MPAASSAAITLLPVGRYPKRTRLGSLVRAGVDDRAMLAPTGIDVALLSVGVSLLAGALAGGAGVIGGTVLSISPAEGGAG